MLLSTVERSHGNKERREFNFIDAPRDAEILRRWPGLRSTGMVDRRREEGDKVQEETIFMISSYLPKVRMLSQHIRGQRRQGAAFLGSC